MEYNTMAFELLQRFQHGPEWRWKLAQRGAAGSVPGILLAADDLIKQATDYLGLLAEGHGGGFLAMRSHPQVHAAVGLWNDPLLQTRLKILALGGCPMAEIATRLGLDETTVTTATALFFDVIGQLQARDWVLCTAITKEERDGNTDLAAHLRMAYFGGPLVAQTIVDASERLPVVEADRLYDQSLLLHMKAQQATAVPLRGEKNVVKFLQLFLEYKYKTAKLDLACEKFRHRCEQELRRQQSTDQPTETTTEEPITQEAMPKVA
jgi:hypothetical protein